MEPSGNVDMVTVSCFGAEKRRQGVTEKVWQGRGWRRKEDDGEMMMMIVMMVMMMMMVMWPLGLPSATSRVEVKCVRAPLPLACASGCRCPRPDSETKVGVMCVRAPLPLACASGCRCPRPKSPPGMYVPLPAPSPLTRHLRVPRTWGQSTTTPFSFHQANCVENRVERNGVG